MSKTIREIANCSSCGEAKYGRFCECLFCDASLCPTCTLRPIKLNFDNVSLTVILCKGCTNSLREFMHSSRPQLEAFKKDVIPLLLRHICLNKLNNEERQDG